MAASSRQPHAHRPGTNAGRASAVWLYLAFCKRIHIKYTRVSYCHICWFVEYLASRGYSPGSIHNNIAHIRTFYKLAGVKDAPLYHYRVTLALRAVSTTIRRKSVAKLPVTPMALKAVLVIVRTHQDPLPLILAILLMFLGFLRQSSVSPPTARAFDPTRHLTQEDATLTQQGLIIKLKWSKTIQKSCDLKTLLLPATKDRNTCPVRAYKAYMKSRPGAHPQDPLLTFEDGNPLTTRYIAR